MATKQNILDNVDMYSADELVEYITKGTVTFEELCEETDGYFSIKLRKEVEEKLSGSEEKEWQKAKTSNTKSELENFLSVYPGSIHCDEARMLIGQIQVRNSLNEAEQAWKEIDKNSIDALSRFIEDFPNNIHCNEARKLIDELEDEGIDNLLKKIRAAYTNNSIIDVPKYIYNLVTGYLDSNKLTHNDFLKIIRDDHNLFGSLVLKDFLDNGYLSKHDLNVIEIEKGFITCLKEGVHPEMLPTPNRDINKINKLSTEVYFWGVPSSGKSCALGAILSVANNGKVAKTMLQDNDCQGYDYMNRLGSLFSTKDVSVLPNGTDIYTTYEMAFDLVDFDGKRHPITCLDFAGELVRALYMLDTGKNLDVRQYKAANILTNVLISSETKTRNKKIHFFVIEYGAENKKYDGLRQSVYLNGALQYINRCGVFKNDTVAIYLIITKVDKANANPKERKNILCEYVKNNYESFYNGLETICKENEINNGKVDIIPFSLGNVCFQDYCQFNETPAANIVRELLERTKGFKNNRFHRFTNILKK